MKQFRGFGPKLSGHWFVPCLTALALSACGGEDENQDAAGARELLARVSAENYREWPRAPGWEARKPSSAPHGAEVDIYVNDRVAAVLAAGEPLEAWPEGSTIVKDGWQGAQLKLIAIVDKRSDGWYWAEYDAGGEPMYSGRPNTCTSCHSSGSDGVRAFSLP